jgi:hypothetical protein
MSGYAGRRFTFDVQSELRPAQPELRDWIKIDRRLPRDILNVFYSEKSEVMQHGMQDEGDFDARKIFDHFRK